jgi:DNA-directed RNA polymerase specialized sigma24 family protein
MDYGEISEIMNISEQGARNLLYKTFEKIRKKYPEGLILLSVIQFN